MAYTPTSPTTAQIEREIDDDRRRIEEKIDAIQQRLSPGQLVDEIIAYAKSSGGGEYVANLGTAMKNNPIPLVLMGISLAWLMTGPKSTLSSYAETVEYPLATVKGNVRRMGPVQADGDKRYSHFVDDAGTRYRALTDEAGKRAGHFVDDTGKTFRGLADAAGQQIQDIRDEAGVLFDQASGWASHTWQRVTNSAGKLGEALADAGRGSYGASAQIGENALARFRDQPLVGGALAFAMGAALGATLPYTQREDSEMGALSDDIKRQASAGVSKVLRKAAEVAEDVSDRVVSAGGDIHDEARNRIAEEVDQLSGVDERMDPAGDLR
ncbi:nutrient deprivation-induced protein [Rhizobium sp. R72]|uniref:DUF3618 domain-containing protein n=1 Tax=unclassified Rhizobium TaxID=2613769 RepID=UPI000B535CAE|nr:MULTISPECIES: DUF3618 domain-containing protein [unclassified Rhizobium]OWW00139.1 nutrient deprivation-induced protein [Rhizobium sp. R72]OWW00530.1 nutrient deprivation-induced protein [Rhizobium sp. R711]